METQTSEQDDADNVVHFEFDPADLRARPSENIDAIAKALSQGYRVELSPIGHGARPPSLSPEALDRFLDVTAVFLGSTILMLVSIVVAPESVTTALVAAVTGGLGAAGGMWLFRRHERKSKVLEPLS